MEASDLKHIKKLEEENVKLKKMYANLALELDTARYIIKKSCKALSEKTAYYRTEYRAAKGHQQGVSVITRKL